MVKRFHWWDERARLDLVRSLALESWLLDAGPGPDPVLMLWRSPPSVVLGKNQNAWRECNHRVRTERGIALARRETGGGTVFQDAGNLNISLAMPRTIYDPELLPGLLIRTLSQFGLEARGRKGGALWIGDHKVSGAAYGYRRDRVLHHATLLVDADLPVLRAVLSPPRLQMASHAVDSVPAPVSNLKEICPDIGLEPLLTALRAEAGAVLGKEIASTPIAADAEGMALRIQRMQSIDWIWHQGPRFRIRVLLEYKDFHLEVHRGRMVSVLWGEIAEELDFPFDAEGCGHLDEHFQLASCSVQKALEESGWCFPLL